MPKEPIVLVLGGTLSQDVMARFATQEYKVQGAKNVAHLLRRAKQADLLVVALLLSLFMTACTLPDPAPAFCEQHGGRYELRRYREDALRGYCVFPDNSICEAEAFYRGRCQPERSLGQANPLPTGANIAAAVPAPTTLDELLNSAPLIFIGEIGPVVQYGTFAGYGPDGKMLAETDPAGNPLPRCPSQTSH